MINQNQIKHLITDTLISLKLVPGRQNEIIFCKELATFYIYEINGSGYTPDDQYIIVTFAGGNTRWLGIAGRYANP